MRDRKRWALALLLGSALVLALLAGCQPAQQENGGEENGGEEEAASLEIGIVADWAESGHAIPITRAAGEEGCMNCHDGLTFSETGGGFQPRFEAEEATGNAESEEETAAPRDWIVATDCRACHTGRGVEIAEAGSIEGVPGVESAEGGVGALCMACHNGFHPAGAEGDELTAPHHSTMTDMLYGVNTLQVGSREATASEEESQSPHLEVEDTCVGCHVAGGEEGPNHLFTVEDYSGCEREDCHDTDMTDGGEAEEDYDGDGQTETNVAEVEGLLEQLASAVNEAAGSTEFRSERGQITFEGGEVAPDDPAYAAAYNYLYVTDGDRSRGVHNTKFTIRLLQNSIAGLEE